MNPVPKSSDTDKMHCHQRWTPPESSNVGRKVIIRQEKMKHKPWNYNTRKERKKKYGSYKL